jgi:hypothetical protein
MYGEILNKSSKMPITVNIIAPAKIAIASLELGKKTRIAKVIVKNIGIPPPRGTGVECMFFG